MKTTSKPSVWLIAVLLSFLAFNLPGQGLPPAAAGPTTIMEFEAMEYDFGTIEEGTVVSQVYTFTNTGDEPLILSNARGSCTMTVVYFCR